MNDTKRTARTDCMTCGNIKEVCRTKEVQSIPHPFVSVKFAHAMAQVRQGLQTMRDCWDVDMLNGGATYPPSFSSFDEVVCEFETFAEELIGAPEEVDV